MTKKRLDAKRFELLLFAAQRVNLVFSGFELFFFFCCIFIPFPPYFSH